MPSQAGTDRLALMLVSTSCKWVGCGEVVRQIMVEHSETSEAETHRCNKARRSQPASLIELAVLPIHQPVELDSPAIWSYSGSFRTHWNLDK